MRNNDTGQEVQFNCTDQVAPQGQYFFGARFGVKEGSSVAGASAHLEVDYRIDRRQFYKALSSP